MEKIALVTGSSRGIGRAVATELARQGWAVCINYREREDCARSLAEQLTGEGCRVMAVQADVACRGTGEYHGPAGGGCLRPGSAAGEQRRCGGTGPVSGHHR